MEVACLLEKIKIPIVWPKASQIFRFFFDFRFDQDGEILNTIFNSKRHMQTSSSNYELKGV